MTPTIALTLLLTVTSTGQGTTTDPGPVVTTAWLSTHLADPRVRVIYTGDERPDRAHIPGARFLAHDATMGASHALLDPQALAAALARAGATDEARIVLYGDAPMATGWLYMAFASIGHADHVSMLDGNVAAWVAEGRPTSTSTEPPGTGRLTPRPAPDVIVDAPWVRARLETPGTRILDVRTDREWRAGHLPGATLVLWQDLFSNVSQARFKPREDIVAILRRAGAGPDQEVVTYCAIGMRASLMYFAARYAGLRARVYVGSFDDWQRQAGFPIVR